MDRGGPRELTRTLPPDVIERRLRQLRAIGAYPPFGRPVIVAPGSTETDTARDLVVIARTPEEDAAAHALRARLQRKIYIIDSHATAEDVAAALAHASGAAASQAAEASQQRLRDQITSERAIFAEAVNRFREGDLDVATLVRDNAWLTREWSDEKHAHALAEQRTEEAEARANAVETRLDEIAAAHDQLAMRLAEQHRELTNRHAELERARAELLQTRDQLEVARAENERHRLVLRTRIVAAALRVQQWLAGWRRK